VSAYLMPFNVNSPTKMQFVAKTDCPQADKQYSMLLVIPFNIICHKVLKLAVLHKVYLSLKHTVSCGLIILRTENLGLKLLIIN